MKDIIESIKKSISSENYYAALFLSLTLPSICGALESENGQDSKKKYISWYEKYITDLFLKGEDCYRLRCSLLHQGKTSHKDAAFTRVIFTYPDSGMRMHNNILNDALNLDIVLFCEKIIQGVEKWQKNVENTENYRKNIVNTIKVHPHGIWPFINKSLIS